MSVCDRSYPREAACRPRGSLRPELTHFVPTMSENRHVPLGCPHGGALGYRLPEDRGPRTQATPFIPAPALGTSVPGTRGTPLCLGEPRPHRAHVLAEDTQQQQPRVGRTLWPLMGTLGPGPPAAALGWADRARSKPSWKRFSPVPASGGARPTPPGGGLGAARSGFRFGAGALAAHLPVCL